MPSQSRSQHSCDLPFQPCSMPEGSTELLILSWLSMWLVERETIFSVILVASIVVRPGISFVPGHLEKIRVFRCSTLTLGILQCFFGALSVTFMSFGTRPCVSREIQKLALVLLGCNVDKGKAPWREGLT